MNGTRIYFAGAGPYEAKTLAQKLGDSVKLQQVGTRSYWESPSQREVVSILGGAFQFSLVTIYHDGNGVFLYLGGPRVPTSNADFARLYSALRLNLRYTDIEIVSNTRVD